jgi:flagellar protein FlgJ
MDPDLFASTGFLDAATTARDTQSAPSITPGQDPRAAAEEFEAFFLGQVLESMTKDLKLDEPFGGGPGEETWRSFLNDQYAHAMMRAGGIGLADRLTSEIIALQAKETT